jgi:hypothetical protein
MSEGKANTIGGGWQDRAGVFANSSDDERRWSRLEDTLISVWRQALVDDAMTVMLKGETFPVRRTSRAKLRELDFRFNAEVLRGLEQNPNTNSRWAQTRPGR